MSDASPAELGSARERSPTLRSFLRQSAGSCCSSPAGIIAFTFTDRAAAELKTRISARVEQRMGNPALDRPGAAFVGTIHAYCFRLLQQPCPGMRRSMCKVKS
jgi:ATP-dependent exoDNAse (exonuclease V) beta subunit